MLDDVTSTASHADDDLPRPPRGRRAKTRPAGPPEEAPAAAPEPAPSEPAADEPAAAVGPADDGAPVDGPETAEDAADEPADDVTAASDGQGHGGAPADESPSTGERPAARSRARWPDPVDIAIAAVLDEAGAQREAERAELAGLPEPGPVEVPTGGPSAGGPDDRPDAEAEETPAPARRPARRRSSRARVAESEPAADGEQDGSGSRPRGRRRRTAADADDSAAQRVGALLSEAEREAAGRDRRAEDGADEQVDKQAVLDSLTAAIAGGEQAPAEPAGEADGPAAEQETAPEDEGGENAADEQGTRRRRRRRGGRRRHRGEQSDETEDGAEGESGGSDEDADKDGSKDSGAESSEAGQGQHRRRRRRRRRGEDTGGSDDDPSDVVVRVREPRHSAVDEVTGIEGSTRLEAKRQRRKEGRAAGRRRAPILSEAEFLARRESVNRKMVIRQREEYTQLAVLEDDVLVEHYVDRKASTSLIGNIYLGKVQNVLPSMEAAFIDIGRGRNAVLYAGEVNWDLMPDKNAPHAIEAALKPGQTVLVQVSKDPVGAKGARLTGHVSLPGRYVVYSPDGHLSGISRKLPDTERHRLKGIVNEAVDESSSVIVRTAAEGVSADDLRHDVTRLKAQWEVIEKKVAIGNAPQQLYAEPDLTLRIVRDLFTEDFSELVIAGSGGPGDAFDTIDAYVEHIAPRLRDRLQHWDDEKGDPFTAHRIDEQISKALERKVFLPSGGSLVIDRTEAMTVIDVNTGKFTGTGGNLEETVTKNNLEAAEEIVRQLRLRDLGGIIVVDFIDMVLPANRELLLRRLVECLGRDRTRHQVSEVTSLGLVQMTRKRIGTGLAEAFTVECDKCGGRGYIRHDEPVASQAPADGGERHRRGRRGGKKSGS